MFNGALMPVFHQIGQEQGPRILKAPDEHIAMRSLYRPADFFQARAEDVAEQLATHNFVLFSPSVSSIL